MKKTIRKCALILGMLTVISSYANKVPCTSTITEINKTILELENVKKGNQLKIIDANGNTIHREQIHKSGNYVKDFDLTTLPNGSYFFELDKDYEIKVIPFKVVNRSVSFNKNNRKTIFKPIVHKRGGTVYVSRLSFNANAINFKIYYEDNPDFIVKEKFENEKKMERIYDFSKARRGNYKIVFKTEGRVFVENINI